MVEGRTVTETLTQSTTRAGSRFFPVSIESFDDASLDLDLSLKYPGEPTPTLYRAKGVPFTKEDRARLVQQGIQFVWVPEDQHAQYRTALNRKLDSVFQDPAIREAERAQLIRKSCGRLIEEICGQPGGPSVEGVTDLSRQFATWAKEDNKKFSGLLDMSEHDFYTATHMLNVGVGCGLLVRELRPNDEEFFLRVTEGGLLHDIGKRGVPLSVLNKEGKLTDEEFALIKRHPLDGFKELHERPGISPIILEMTRDHHEKLDGKGYPQGLKGSEISFAARICAVVDVFDAITAARPYRGATHPSDTLTIMSDGVGAHFDEEIFEAWRRVIGRMLEEDPSRSNVARRETTYCSLSTLIPSTPAPAKEGSDLDGADADENSAEIVPAEYVSDLGIAVSPDERRRHIRHYCSLGATAVFLRQGKPAPVGPGGSFPLQVKDISRGGMRVATPWPLTNNDLLRVKLRRGDGEVVERYAMVVRVRSGKKNEWFAGLRFIERPDGPGGALSAG